MIPKAQLRVDLPTSRLAELDPLLRGIPNQQHEDEDSNETCVLWSLSPEHWHFLPRIRREIARFPDCYSTSQSYLTNDDDPWDASLAFVRPDVLPGARVLSGKRSEKYCQYCEQSYDTLPSTPSFTVTLPAPLLVPGLFNDEDQKLKLVSEDFLDELARAGLDRGLAPLPVTVDGKADRPYFALVAPTLLYEAQPWGSELPTRPCSHCGARASAHLFFPLFEKPTDPDVASQDWFHELILGPTAPIVTKRVADWLRGPGKEWASKPMYGSPPRFVRCGWDPDDRLIASLPERFQGVSDAVIEPLRPEEYPLPWPPKKARGKTAG